MPYHGETTCERPECVRRAYYLCDGDSVCGACSKNHARAALPKRPAHEKQALQEEKARIDDAACRLAAVRNCISGRAGKVMLTKLRMLKAPQDLPGFLKVFPNFKHQNRVDGFGCASLSPMAMGPVQHGQPGLPPATSIENFHQGSKCFPQELKRDGTPSPLYYTNRHKFYTDATPHRHKYKGTQQNPNIPEFFVWVGEDGKENRLDYVGSRQFYCTFYERFAAINDDFARLLDLREDGVNLQLVGYDANPITGEDAESIEAAYLDDSTPFGHERVLYAMLLLDPLEYPWRKHKTFKF